jgi:hypothetical protein
MNNEAHLTHRFIILSPNESESCIIASRRPEAWYSWTMAMSSFPCAFANPDSAENEFISLVRTSK